MFPFNLAGPHFLIFYTALGLALIVLNWRYLRRHTKPSGADHTKAFFNAPYSLAFLNRGADHCLSICAFNLIDRGLMTANAADRISSQALHTKQVSHPLEHALVQYAAANTKALFAAKRDNKVKAALHAIHTTLCDAGLLTRRTFFPAIKLISLGILGLVTAIKIAVALSHGHNNIQLLILLAIIFLLVLIFIPAPRLTADGEDTLSLMRGLLAQLQGRMQELKPGGFTQEASLAAALFGLGGLSREHFPYLGLITPPVAVSSASSSDSGSSSSCSSCSSSDSSSCGGGGCGGCGS